MAAAVFFRRPHPSSGLRRRSSNLMRTTFQRVAGKTAAPFLYHHVGDLSFAAQSGWRLRRRIASIASNMHGDYRRNRSSPPPQSLPMSSDVYSSGKSSWVSKNETQIRSEFFPMSVSVCQSEISNLVSASFGIRAEGARKTQPSFHLSFSPAMVAVGDTQAL